MTEYSALENLIGPVFTQALLEIQFKEASEKHIHLTSIAEASVPIVTPVMTDKQRKNALYRYEKYFEEAASMIQIQAAEKFAGIIIKEDFCSKMVENGTALIRKGFFGDEKYIPFMEELNINNNDILRTIRRCVFVNIAGLVIKEPNSVNAKLYWFASANATKATDDNPELLKRVCILDSKAGH